ncbi:MAG: carbohydrate porin, partial [Bacteroidota bacterium]
FIADQLIISESADDGQGLGTLLQMGYSPENSSINDFYMAYGLNYTGLFSGRDADMLGLAVAHSSLNDDVYKGNPSHYETCETAIECTYKYKTLKNITIQPNIQYIIHPGMQSTYDNALVGLLRIQWEYN